MAPYYIVKYMTEVKDAEEVIKKWERENPGETISEVTQWVKTRRIPMPCVVHHLMGAKFFEMKP